MGCTSTAMGQAQNMELMKLHSSCLVSEHEHLARHVAVHVAGCDSTNMYTATGGLKHALWHALSCVVLCIPAYGVREGNKLTAKWTKMSEEADLCLVEQAC